MRGWTYAAVAHAIDAGARTVRAGVIQVRRCQTFRGFAAIDTGEQEGCGALEDVQRGAVEKIREAHVNGFLATADGQSEAAVGVELDAKAGWAAVAV